MTVGVTTGKFYPFHLGHDYLLRQAKKQVDRLVVIVGFKPEQDISGEIRADWIRQQHPDIDVILSLEDIPNDSKLWGERTLQILDVPPDIVFTSEDYGAEWADFMGCQHIMIDRNREQFSISGTDLRDDLSNHWDMLTPPAKAYFAKRVCCIGVESSGTTTLAEKLAEYYQTVWIPEYGRWYWEGRRYTPNQEQWDTDEFVKIAQGQIRWEDDLSLQANRLVVCDTDALATHVWHKRYVGHYSEAVEAVADSREYDLYLLTEPDFGFIQDGTREGEHIRMEMHGWFTDELTRKNHKFIRVTGSHDNRMAQVTEAINKLLQFPKLEIV